MAQNANRMANVNQNNASKAMAKLSSGLRINSAADDAAGLSISEKMKGQINGLNQASTNAQTGISMVQTADGALNETTANLQRMRELAVQSSSDTNTTADRNAIQKEMNQLTAEVTRVASTTQFNTQNLLDGSAGVVTGGVKTTIPDVPAVPTVPAVQGVFTAPTVGAANVTIDGTVLTYDLSADGSGTDGKFKDVASLVLLVNNTVALSSKYTASTSGGTNLTLTQKVGQESATDAVIAGAGLQPAATTEGVVGVVGSADVPAHDVTTGGTSAFTFQIGANQGQTLTANIKDMRSFALGISGVAGTDSATGADSDVIGAAFVTDSTNDLSDVSNTGEHALDLSSAVKASAAIKVLDEATATVSSERAQIGAYQNRLESTINTLGTTSQNLTAAQSSITDVDMAATMSEYSKANIESQAAQAMIAQANQQPQQVLQLLR